MSPERQRIVIAEACGWRRATRFKSSGWIEPGLPEEEWVIFTNVEDLPDYPSDLNACHDMEEVLDRHQQRRDYMNRLERGHMSITTQITWPACHATAAQRCEAFLKTIGKWEEDE